MAVRTRGIVQLRGESGSPLPVDVFVDKSRITLRSGPQVIGDWETGSYGIKSLDEGFAIWVEGEEAILKTDDDVAIAIELGLWTSSVRMARRVAAAKRPTELPWPDPPPREERSHVGAIAFALAGVLVLAGAMILRADPALSAAERTAQEGLGAPGRFWFAFALGGMIMLLSALALAGRARWGRAAAILSVTGLVVVFGIAAQRATPEADNMLAYGFIAGGIIIGVAVLFGGLLGERD